MKRIFYAVWGFLYHWIMLSSQERRSLEPGDPCHPLVGEGDPPLTPRECERLQGSVEAIMRDFRKASL